MLSWYCEATAGYLSRYSWLSPGLLWQRAQVRGRFSLNTGERGFFADSMSCVEWQSEQDAAADAPMDRLIPWMLAPYASVSFAWQAAQFTGRAATSSSGCFCVRSA